MYEYQSCGYWPVAFGFVFVWFTIFSIFHIYIYKYKDIQDCLQYNDVLIIVVLFTCKPRLLPFLLLALFVTVASACPGFDAAAYSLLWVVQKDLLVTRLESERADC